VSVVSADNAGNETTAKKVITVNPRPTSNGNGGGPTTNGGGGADAGDAARRSASRRGRCRVRMARAL